MCLVVAFNHRKRSKSILEASKVPRNSFTFSKDGEPSTESCRRCMIVRHGFKKTETPFFAGNMRAVSEMTLHPYCVKRLSHMTRGVPLLATLK